MMIFYFFKGLGTKHFRICIISKVIENLSADYYGLSKILIKC
jgi:hypothetical protein